MQIIQMIVQSIIKSLLNILISIAVVAMQYAIKNFNLNNNKRIYTFWCALLTHRWNCGLPWIWESPLGSSCPEIVSTWNEGSTVAVRVVRRGNRHGRWVLMEYSIVLLLLLYSMPFPNAWDICVCAYVMRDRLKSIGLQFASLACLRCILPGLVLHIYPVAMRANCLHISA